MARLHQNVRLRLVFSFLFSNFVVSSRAIKYPTYEALPQCCSEAQA